MDSGAQELIDELAYAWLEMHKKSGLTYLVLHALSEREQWAKSLEQWLHSHVDWDIHERALYRTLQRLESQGLIVHTTVSVARTGADRKVYGLTPVGEAFLRAIRSETEYLKTL